MSADAVYEIEEIREPARFDLLEDDWNELLASSGGDIPFLRHEWLRLWWRRFGGRHGLALFLARRGGRLVLGLPLMETRTRAMGVPLAVLQSTTNEHSFRFDLVLRRGEEAAASAVWRHLRGRPGWDLIQLREVTWPGCAAAALHDAAVDDGSPVGVWLSYNSPYLPLDGTFEEYLSRLRAKFRSNLRNRTKRLAGLGPVTFDVIEDREAAIEALPGGLAIEAGGWKGTAGSAIAADSSLAGFYTDWAALAADRDWLRLQFLRMGGRPVAFDYSIRYKGTLYCLKIGYDESLAALSVGQLLKARILERAFRDGFREYDFLGPMMDAKADWGPSARRHAWLFLYNRGPLARLAYAYKFRLRAGVRRLLQK